MPKPCLSAVFASWLFVPVATLCLVPGVSNAPDTATETTKSSADDSAHASSPSYPEGVPVYHAPHTNAAIHLDGLPDAAWDTAPWTDWFVDIEGNPHPTGKAQPHFATRAKMLWTDDAIWFYVHMEEPHVWGSLLKRNAIIYHDNDIEVFIDPDGDRLDYYEFEMNPLNTIMELVLDKPYSDGGNYRFIQLPGVQSAVAVQGSLNNPYDTDQGWSVEIKIPFADLANTIHGVGRKQSPTPAPGSSWRLNFSRVEWTHTVKDGGYVKVPKSEKDEGNWVWSPTGKIDMHRPEHWGVVVFEK